MKTPGQNQIRSSELGRTPRLKLQAYPEIPSSLMEEKYIPWYPGLDMDADKTSLVCLEHHLKAPHQHENFGQHQKSSFSFLT